MKIAQIDIARRWYLQHRRENFAASQRLEGINHPIAARNADRPLPSKTDLLKKYRPTSGS